MKSIFAPIMLFGLFTTAGCSDPPGTGGPSEVVASTPRGGVVRFSGVLVLDAVGKAQGFCANSTTTSGVPMNAVPIGFYKIGVDTMGRDQIMTFECK